MPSIITKLFIGGVPPCMDKDSLADLFMEAKEISNLPPCKLLDVICHQGFGFITMGGLNAETQKEY
jgi:hypothetical protein